MMMIMIRTPLFKFLVFFFFGVFVLILPLFFNRSCFVATQYWINMN